MTTFVCTSWRSGALSAVLVLLMGLVLTLPSTARAQAGASNFPTTEAPCPEDVAAEITRQVRVIQLGLKKAYRRASEMWMADRDDSLFDAMSVCVSLAWPTGGWKFTLPTLDAIIEALLREAVRRICREARDAVRNVESIFGGDSYYMDSPIPGMGRIIDVGYGSQGAPSASLSVNGDPASFYVHVPSTEEWTKILPPEAVPAVQFTPDSAEAATQEIQP